jgi:hypothetical protein
MKVDSREKIGNQVLIFECLTFFKMRGITFAVGHVLNLCC